MVSVYNRQKGVRSVGRPGHGDLALPIISPLVTFSSNDLDYFHDSAERAGLALSQGQKTLVEAGYAVTIRQVVFLQDLIRKGNFFATTIS